SFEEAIVPACRAVVAAGEVITYVRHRVAAAFFRRVHDALAPRGLFLFDFIESAERRTYPPRRMEGDGWSLVASAGVNASGRILTRRLEMTRQTGERLRRSRETHRVRIYRRGEISKEPHAGDLKIWMQVSD